MTPTHHPYRIRPAVLRRDVNGAHLIRVLLVHARADQLEEHQPLVILRERDPVLRGLLGVRFPECNFHVRTAAPEDLRGF